VKRLSLLVLIFLVACASSTPTPQMIETSAAASTFTPLPPATQTLAPTPTASITSTALSVAAEPTLADITSRLAESSRRYIANNEVDAIKVAQAVDFLGDASHPANMCGPLSAAQLRDVGLIPDYVNLHDFWLLDPRDKRYILDQYFPAEYFTNKYYETPIHRFNFNKFPLQVGDFVYIYQGGEGNFEHMLVVTRVDAQGRAYSVTNVHTWEDKYLIPEVMLYDPNTVGAGQFYDWATLDNPIGMITGYGGFEVWRPIKAPRVISEKDKALVEQVNVLFPPDSSARVFITRDRDVLYARYSHQPISFDSATNLPITLLFFTALDSKNIPPADYPGYLQQTGYDLVLQRLLTQSDSDAANTLLAFIRAEQITWRATLTSWGASSTDLDYRRITATDISTLFYKLYRGALLNPAARQIILLDMKQADISSGRVYLVSVGASQIALIDTNNQIYTIAILGGEINIETVIGLLIR
jgi:hypothetical protein